MRTAAMPVRQLEDALKALTDAGAVMFDAEKLDPAKDYARIHHAAWFLRGYDVNRRCVVSVALTVLEEFDG